MFESTYNGYKWVAFDVSEARPPNITPSAYLSDRRSHLLPTSPHYASTLSNALHDIQTTFTEQAMSAAAAAAEKKRVADRRLVVSSSILKLTADLDDDEKVNVYLDILRSEPCKVLQATLNNLITKRKRNFSMKSIEKKLLKFGHDDDDKLKIKIEAAEAFYNKTKY